MNLDRFWTSLDHLPDGQASAYEWCVEAGDKAWPLIRTFLRKTGARAERVPCPSPGGDNCPRIVGPLRRGKCKIYCGDTPPECEAETVELEDILVHQIDLIKLGEAINKAFGLQPAAYRQPSSRVHHCGTHHSPGGLGVSVVLLVLDGNSGGRLAALEAIAMVQKPALLLTPTPHTLKAEEKAHVERHGVHVRTFADILTVAANGRLIASENAAQTLEQLSRQGAAVVQNTRNAPIFDIAPDAAWSHLTIDFVEEWAIRAFYNNQEKRLEPEMLGMKNERSGRPTTQWELLKILAQNNGEVPMPAIGTSGASDKGKKNRDSVKTQKYKLSQALKNAFQIPGEPFSAVGGAYRANFVIRASGLRPAHRRAS